MSLRVWLPLTKDLRQQGLDNVTVTNNGATFNSAGKLGGCYLFDGSNDYLVGTYAAGAEISFAAWINMPTLPGGRHIFDARTSAGVGYQPMYLNNGSIQVGCSGSGSGYPSFNYTWIANTWYHICVTHNTTEVKCYVNGVLIGTSTTGKGVSLGTCNFTLGSRCNQANYSNVKINDVRIYDHCLSPMEVKELAKGLILHYPLNRGGWGQENLITNSKLDGSWTYPSSSYSDKYSPITTIVPSATQYTLSFDAKSTVNGDKMRTHYYSPNTTTTCVSSQGTTKTAADGHMDFTLTTQWERYWVTYTQTETTAVKHLICPRLVSGQGTGTVSVKNVKFEEGSIATPWCPNSSDTLATTMGLNSTTEYDCSGFCNNGTRIGTFTWTSNTPKYAVSQVFNGSDNAIQTPNLTTMVTDKNYTVACWTYKTVIGTKNYQTIYGGPSGFELEARSSSSTSPLYRIHNWGGGTTAYNFGEWTHFCFVHTDSDSKLYVNGVLKITGSSANVPSGNYFVGAWNTSTSQNYEGNMSDFRIYATALSADDVKSLYQNSAYIDSSGNVYGAVHSEV